MTPKQERFVAEYLIDLNATKAAIRAGYSPKTAFIIAHENLRKPKINTAIEERQNRLAAKLELSAERVLTELARIGFSDVRGLFDDDGNLYPVHELPDDVAAFVASVQVTTHIRRSPNGTTVTFKVRLWDKVRALELLMRHLGLLKERMHVPTNEALFARLDAGRQRNAEEYRERLRLAGKGSTSS